MGLVSIRFGPKVDRDLPWPDGVWGTIRIDQRSRLKVTMHRVFIGYDARETVAFTVLCNSILRRARSPVTISPIMLSMIGGIFDRPRHPLQSTDFSFSRFLTPYLSEFRGWSLFMDCDMLMLADIGELFAMADDRYAVMCVKHDYQPKEGV